MANEVKIDIIANSEKFQIAIEKAVKKVQEFGTKNRELSSVLDTEYRNISRAATSLAGDIGTSFNALKITSDFGMSEVKARLNADKAFFRAHFQAIAENADSSVGEIKRAFRSLTAIEADFDAQALKNEFATLGIESAASIEAAKIKIKNAFAEIEQSGIKSPKDIARAYEAMTAQIASLDAKLSSGTSKRVANEEAALTKLTSINATELKKMKSHWAEMNGQEIVEGSKKAAGGINLLSLASIAAIAKVQVLYSLVNTIMSAIGSLPGTAIDAIEDFNASTIKSAAVITSMVGDANNLGEAYKQNKIYADAVQNTLIKMDATTIASYKQLQIMNEAFQLQGVFIDINNQKQLDGYRNIANALGTITANMPNAEMQFSQEIRALMSGELRPGDQLAKQLTAIDPLLKQHLAEWKQIAYETNNAGYILEKLGPLLQGYAAASGDINGLWATIKSTLSTIYNEILRGGLSEGFKEIVEQMKELAKYAQENKEHIQAFLKEGFKDAKEAATLIWKIADTMSFLGKPAMYAAAALGISSIIAKVVQLGIAIKGASAISAGGILGRLLMNPAGAIATAGVIATSKIYDWSKQNEADKRRIENIKSLVPDIKSNDAEQIRFQRGATKFLDVKTLRSIMDQLPLATDSEIAMYFREGAISGVGAGLKIDKARIEKLKAEAAGEIKIPSALKPDTSKELEKERKAQEEVDKNYEAYLKKIRDNEIEDQRNSSKEKLEELRRSHDEGLLSTKDYYDKKLETIKSANDLELQLSQESIDAMEEQSKMYADLFEKSNNLEDYNKEIESDIKIEDLKAKHRKLELDGIKQIEAAKEESRKTRQATYQEAAAEEIKVLELAGATVTAEEMKQAAYKETAKYKQLSIDSKTDSNAKIIKDAIDIQNASTKFKKQQELNKSIREYGEAINVANAAIDKLYGKNERYNALTAEYRAGINKEAEFQDQLNQLKQDELNTIGQLNNAEQQKLNLQKESLQTQLKLQQLQTEKTAKAIEEYSRGQFLTGQAIGTAGSYVTGPTGETTWVEKLIFAADYMKEQFKYTSDKDLMATAKAESASDKLSNSADKLSSSGDNLSSSGSNLNASASSLTAAAGQFSSFITNFKLGQQTSSISGASGEAQVTISGLEPKAIGGDTDAYTPYIVGEKGPELFMSKQAGSIVPNDVLRSSQASSGGSVTTISGGIQVVLPNVTKADDYDAIANGILAKLKIKGNRFL